MRKRDTERRGGCKRGREEEREREGQGEKKGEGETETDPASFPAGIIKHRKEKMDSNSNSRNLSET